MDIEQYEFTAMDKLIQDFAGEPLPIGQLLVEIHLMGLSDDLNRPNFPEFLQWWETLEACGLRPVWTELNLLAVTLHAEDGLPRCAEVSFVPVDCDVDVANELLVFIHQCTASKEHLAA